LEKTEMTRPYGRLWYTWEDNIKMDCKEVGWGFVDWINLAQDRVQCHVPLNMGNILWVP
jgi:hypothetical protein